MIADGVSDPEKWSAILTDWMGHGWNPRNVKAMLDRYKNGAKNVTNSSYGISAFGGGGGGGGHSRDDPTPEELAAWAEWEQSQKGAAAPT